MMFKSKHSVRGIFLPISGFASESSPVMKPGIILYKLLLRLYVEDLLALIIAANLANVLRTKHLVTSGIGALYQSYSGQLRVVRSSGISASLGYFSLWYCHTDTSLLKPGVRPYSVFIGRANLSENPSGYHSIIFPFYRELSYFRFHQT